MNRFKIFLSYVTLITLGIPLSGSQGTYWPSPALQRRAPQGMRPAWAYGLAPAQQSQDASQTSTSIDPKERLVTPLSEPIGHQRQEAQPQELPTSLGLLALRPSTYPTIQKAKQQVTPAPSLYERMQQATQRADTASRKLLSDEQARNKDMYTTLAQRPASVSYDYIRPEEKTPAITTPASPTSISPTPKVIQESSSDIPSASTPRGNTSPTSSTSSKATSPVGSPRNAILGQGTNFEEESSAYENPSLTQTNNILKEEDLNASLGTEGLRTRPTVANPSKIGLVQSNYLDEVESSVTYTPTPIKPKSWWEKAKETATAIASQVGGMAQTLRYGGEVMIRAMSEASQKFLVKAQHPSVINFIKQTQDYRQELKQYPAHNLHPVSYLDKIVQKGYDDSIKKYLEAFSKPPQQSEESTDLKTEPPIVIDETLLPSFAVRRGRFILHYLSSLSGTREEINKALHEQFRTGTHIRKERTTADYAYDLYALCWALYEIGDLAALKKHYEFKNLDTIGFTQGAFRIKTNYEALIAFFDYIHYYTRTSSHLKGVGEATGGVDLRANPNDDVLYLLPNGFSHVLVGQDVFGYTYVKFEEHGMQGWSFIHHAIGFIQSQSRLYLEKGGNEVGQQNKERPSDHDKDVWNAFLLKIKPYLFAQQFEVVSTYSRHPENPKTGHLVNDPYIYGYIRVLKDLQHLNDVKNKKALRSAAEEMRSYFEAKYADLSQRLWQEDIVTRETLALLEPEPWALNEYAEARHALLMYRNSVKFPKTDPTILTRRSNLISQLKKLAFFEGSIDNAALTPWITLLQLFFNLTPETVQDAFFTQHPNAPWFESDGLAQVKTLICSLLEELHKDSQSVLGQKLVAVQKKVDAAVQDIETTVESYLGGDIPPTILYENPLSEAHLKGQEKDDQTRIPSGKLRELGLFFKEKNSTYLFTAVLPKIKQALTQAYVTQNKELAQNALNALNMFNEKTGALLKEIITTAPSLGTSIFIGPDQEKSLGISITSPENKELYLRQQEKFKREYKHTLAIIDHQALEPAVKTELITMLNNELAQTWDNINNWIAINYMPGDMEYVFQGLFKALRLEAIEAKILYLLNKPQQESSN